MTYQLYRLADTSDDLADAIPLGAFEGFEDALAARDEDTVRLFARTLPGQVLVVHHDILGPGIDGPWTAHPVSSAIERRSRYGVDEVADVRGWLARIHTLAT
jgi:hypothetical protein